jgi:hypothetical protein
MPTQIIRNTEGVITTGKFCLFRGSKSKPQTISCDNAGSNFIYTIAYNTSPEYADQFMQAIQSIVVTIDGIPSGIDSINPNNGLNQYEMMDQVYPVPPNFASTTPSVLLNLNNGESRTRRIQMYIPPEYRDVIAFLVPEQPLQQNPAIEVGNGFVEFCLSAAY